MKRAHKNKHLTIKQYSSTIFLHFLIYLTLSAKIILISTIQTNAQTIPSQKIWDKAPHNAFCDLIRFNDHFYCVFREGKNHVPSGPSENGKIRILRSESGKNWESVALLQDPVYDLRDPKISITPDERLMILMGGSEYKNGEKISGLTHVAFSRDGIEFTKPQPTEIEEDAKTNHDWIWRVTWHEGTGYGVVYQSSYQKWSAKLLQTNDGIHYDEVLPLKINPKPNEATIRFAEDNTMYMVIRRGNGANGLLGWSKPPFYTQWRWKNLGRGLGGPDFIFLNDNTICIGSRHYRPENEGGNKTALFLSDLQGKINRTLHLPSGGDTSYPGMVIHNKKLWIAYYAGHEEKTSIYFASVPVDELLP